VTEESTQGTGNRDLERTLAFWLRQLGAAVSALQTLAQAQWQLAVAEWRLTRSAAAMALLAVFLGGLFALTLGLTLLALASWLLADWLGSWLLALAILSAILALCLLGSILLMRRCLYWMSLPQTRARWRMLTHDLARPKPQRRQTPEQGEET